MKQLKELLTGAGIVFLLFFAPPIAEAIINLVYPI